jgi:hypothetical protein
VSRQRRCDAGELARANHSEWAKTKSVDRSRPPMKLTDHTPRRSPVPMTLRRRATTHRRAAVEPRETEREPRLKTSCGERGARVHRRRQGRQARTGLLKEVSLRRGERVPRITRGRSAHAGAGKPGEIPERERKMLAAFDLYLGYVKDPKDDDLVRMKVDEGKRPLPAPLRPLTTRGRFPLVFNGLCSRRTAITTLARTSRISCSTSYYQKNDELALGPRRRPAPRRCQIPFRRQHPR